MHTCTACPWAITARQGQEFASARDVLVLIPGSVDAPGMLHRSGSKGHAPGSSSKDDANQQS
eukprot:4900058-Alexandrium_andersonii.AAC.1